ncbi:hypothetical protein ACFQE1_09530 [Halobium palmae]|uniref:Uncharacterized protein n=1 Tax=Halobium palmae TaxID=1776492 RepID=A0ABD5RZ67_9EURY
MVPPSSQTMNEMNENETQWIGRYDTDGWLEIRETENPTAWVASDRPVEIEE